MISEGYLISEGTLISEGSVSCLLKRRHPPFLVTFSDCVSPSLRIVTGWRLSFSGAADEKVHEQYVECNHFEPLEPTV